MRGAADPLPSGHWCEDGNTPRGSGEFIDLGGGVGQLMVHDLDERHHRPPSGWALYEIERLGEWDIFVYTRGLCG